MGGVATINPASADVIFVNPAFLTYVGGVHWDIVNANLGVNGLQAYNDFKNIGSATTPSDYSTYFGKNLWVELGGHSSFVVPYFGLAAFNNYHISLLFDNPVFPDVKVEYLNDVGYQMGFAIPMGIYSAGIGLKRTTRTGGIQNVSLTNLAAASSTNIANSFTGKGVGYGVDLALMSRIPSPGNPTFTAVWKDVGSTAFLLTEGTDAPPRIKDNLILGFGTLVDLPGLDWTTGIEYKHVNDQGEPLGKKLHLGTELSLPIIDVRAGLYQGYLSYGAGINLFILRLDAAVYSAERGAYPGQKADNRVEASLSIAVDVDADFSISALNTKNHRSLKHRR